jgi:hypothetical protein
MRRSAAILLFLPLIAGGALAASPEAAYIAARDKAIAEVKALEDAKASEDKIQAAEDKASADLAKQLKAIIGPVAIEGFAAPDQLNIALSHYQQGYGELDGVASYGKEKQVLVVTTRSLAEKWLEASSKDEDKTRRQPTGIDAAARGEDFYNSSLYNDVHFSKYADLPVAKPAGADVVVAALGGLSQGFEAELPDTIVATIVKGGRLFVASVPLKTPIGKIRACAPLWAKAQHGGLADADSSAAKSYRACFSQHVPKEGFFAGLTKEAQGLVARFAGD